MKWEQVGSSIPVPTGIDSNRSNRPLSGPEVRGCMHWTLAWICPTVRTRGLWIRRCALSGTAAGVDTPRCGGPGPPGVVREAP